MTTAPRTRLIVGAVAATIVLAGASTVAVAAATGAFRSDRSAPNGACSAPVLPGTVVDVALMNMGGRTGFGPTVGGWAGGMMRVRADREQIQAGTVSLRVGNIGTLVHELVVLPLAAGQHAGQRHADRDGRVEETDSLGEASRSCGEGAGDGIDPGSLGWITLRLDPGDYELVCNLAAHYDAGMYTELHVVA